MDETLAPCVRTVQAPLVPAPGPKASAKAKAQARRAPASITIYLLAPCSLLNMALARFEHFAAMFYKILCPDGARQTRGTRDNPLRLLVYTDECVPGNAVDPSNSRKFMAFFFAFLEYGRWLLTQSSAWMPITVVRSKFMKHIDCSYSWMASCVLREFCVRSPLCGREDGDGCVLHFRYHGDVRVYMRLHAFMADEAALQQCHGSKGASGNKICLKHRNCVRKSSGLDGDGYHIPHDCAVAALFDAETDEGIYYMADTLTAAAGMARNKGHIARLETAFGINLLPRGLLFDLELRPFYRPATGSRLDPMHTWFGNGIAQKEIACFMDESAWRLDNPPRWDQLEELCGADWRFPGEASLEGSRTKAANMFREAKISAEGFPRLSASECLLAVHLVRYFVERTVRRMPGVLPTMQLQIVSMCAMCKAALYSQSVKFGVGSSRALAALSSEYLAARNRAYPDVDALPKHHYMMDLPKQVEDDEGIALDCFPHERKLGQSKQAGTHAHGAGVFEKTVLNHTTWQSFQELDGMLGRTQAFQESCLIEPIVRSPELTAALGVGTSTARSARLRHGHVAAGDVCVLSDASTVVVKAPILRDGQPDVALVAQRTRRVRVVTDHASEYEVLRQVVIVPQGLVLHTCVWAPEAGGRILVLAPL